eukprot:COSAG02_NODE_12509_length_1535_cov_0.991643_3_plen_151_part_00
MHSSDACKARGYALGRVWCPVQVRRLRTVGSKRSLSCTTCGRTTEARPGETDVVERLGPWMLLADPATDSGSIRRWVDIASPPTAQMIPRHPPKQQVPRPAGRDRRAESAAPRGTVATAARARSRGQSRFSRSSRSPIDSRRTERERLQR